MSGDLNLYGVTHQVHLCRVNDDRWEYMLTVSSVGGEASALLTADDCRRIREALVVGRGPGPNTPEPGSVRAEES